MTASFRGQKKRKKEYKRDKTNGMEEKRQKSRRNSFYDSLIKNRNRFFSWCDVSCA